MQHLHLLISIASANGNETVHALDNGRDGESIGERTQGTYAMHNPRNRSIEEKTNGSQPYKTRRLKMVEAEIGRTFTFIYEIQPSPLCSNLLYNSKPFGRNDAHPRIVQFSILQDMLNIFYHDPNAGSDFEALAKQVDSVVALVLAAYAYFTGKPFQFTRKHWVEFKASVGGNILVGKSNIVSYPDLKHADNKPFSAIDELMPLFLNNPPLARALRDLYACSSRVDPDFYFYAYRSVEDIRSYFGSTDTDEERIASWDAMNKALGRKKADYDELVELSKQSRHMNMLDETVNRETATRNFVFVRSLIETFISFLTNPPVNPSPT